MVAKPGKKFLPLAIFVIATALILAGCAQQQTPKTETPEETPKAETVHITVGTGSPGGVYYPLGGAMAELWTKKLSAEGIEVTAESTAASVENSRLVGRGEVQFGMAVGSIAYQAYMGEGKFEEKLPILAAFSMYPAPEHIITTNPDIKTIYDLEGKKVSVGAPGSGNAAIAELILKTAGLWDKVDKQYYSQSDAAQALKDGNVEVVFWNFAFPASAVQEVAAVRDVYFVQMPDEVLKKITSKYPYYKSGIIPAGTYKGQDYDVKVLQVGNDMIVNKGVPEDVVYKMVKTLFENAEELYDVHPVAKQLKPENGVKTAIPLHPGAEKYFKEVGALK